MRIYNVWNDKLIWSPKSLEGLLFQKPDLEITYCSFFFGFVSCWRTQNLLDHHARLSAPILTSRTIHTDQLIKHWSLHVSHCSLEPKQDKVNLFLVRWVQRKARSLNPILYRWKKERPKPKGEKSLLEIVFLSDPISFWLSTCFHFI